MPGESQPQLFSTEHLVAIRATTKSAVGDTAVRRLIENPGKRPGLVNNVNDLPATYRQRRDGRTDEELQQDGIYFSQMRAKYAPSTLPKQEDAAPAVPQVPHVAIGSRAIPWEQRHAHISEPAAPLPEQTMQPNVEAQQSE